MKIKDYFNEIKDKINALNLYVSNPINYNDIHNPFADSMTKTYIWIDDYNKREKH